MVGKMNRHVILKNQANEWENTTPIGCGNLAASIYGGVGVERLQFNEEFLWGGEYKTPPAEFYEGFTYLRSLLQEGKPIEANEWATKNMQEKGIFRRVSSYETAGELFLHFHGETFDGFSDYERVLDMEKGIVRICYQVDGVRYEREYFASYPDNVIAGRISADKKGAICFVADYTREARCFGNPPAGFTPKPLKKSFENGIFTIEGETMKGERMFIVRMVFSPEGGGQVFDEGKIVVTNADACAFFISIETVGRSRRIAPDLHELSKKGYEAVKNATALDHASLFNRSDITIEGDGDKSVLPCSERLSRIQKGERDNGFYELFYNFGKYLLIGSSRKGTLPANLQGKWNDFVKAPWNSDYHTNVNLQMNYWHAETANLGECALPLFAYIQEWLLPSGKRTAWECYRCRGTVVHHLSDLDGMTAPADGVWGLWALGGAWLCYSLWEHYLFTRDEQFLRTTAYPYIAENVRFFLDYMFEDGQGRLLTGPSMSPENKYKLEGKEAYLCLSPTMDVEIISGLFTFYLEAEEILSIDSQMQAEASKALSKLPPLQISKDGRLMEWLEDYEDAEPGHRHISHAFGLYPGCSITQKNPELLAGIRKTIEKRLSFGGGQTGWSASWLVNLYARLLDGEKAEDMLLKLFSNSLKPNLFDIHPPFQIDGNFGATAGILEMLLQSHENCIHLIPALPKSWKNGSFRGLRARGGFEVNAKWEEGTITSFTVKAIDGEGEILVKANGQIYTLSLTKGGERTVALA